MKKWALIITTLVLNLVISIFTSTQVYATFTNPTSTNANYNRDYAYNYITNYLIIPNSKYADFTNDGGDCTNFASQVLKAGGMSFTPTSSNPTYNHWYYYNPTWGTGRSNTWTAAHDFRQHWADINNVGKKRAYRFTKYTVGDALSDFTSIRDDVYAGDIIQHCYADGKTYHSQIVYGFPNDDITVAQHTGNTIKSLKKFLKEKQMSGNGNGLVCVIQIKWK